VEKTHPGDTWQFISFKVAGQVAVAHMPGGSFPGDIEIS
jgi:hypothetical protein